MTRILSDEGVTSRVQEFAEEVASVVRAYYLANTQVVRIEDVGLSAICWRSNGDIFSIEHEGVEYFPQFQFRNGQPHPTIKMALSAFPSEVTSWNRAFWFVVPDSYLGGKSPHEALENSNAVVASAKREAKRLIEQHRRTVAIVEGFKRASSYRQHRTRSPLGRG
jgi:hypothetical protein